MRVITSSKIAEFGFCNLTWKHRERGTEASNPERLASGAEYHHSIGKSIEKVKTLELSSSVANKIAIILIILSAIGGLLWLLF